MDNTHEGVVVVITSYAKGNFKRIRKITKFLNNYELYAVVNKGDIDETKSPIIIEINVLNESKKHIPPQIKNFLKVEGLDKYTTIIVKDGNELPSFTEMAKSFGSALFSTGKLAVKNLVSGKNSVTVSESEKERRMSICKQCPFFNEAKTQCKKCGCRMKYKTALTTASCPIKKW